MTTAGSRSRTVLYIEDNAANAILFCHMTRRIARLEVVIATTGREGLAIAAQRRPDAIILDAHLPDMTGAAVLARLDEIEGVGDVPTVVVTADATLRGEQMRPRDPVVVITKPFDVSELLGVLERMLGGAATGGEEERWTTCA